MKSITLDDVHYNKIKTLANQKGTSLVEVMRTEVPILIDRMKQTEYKKMKYSKKGKEQVQEAPVATAPTTPFEVTFVKGGTVTKDENKSLANIALDIAEMDLDAPENQEYLTKSFAALGNKIDRYVGFNEVVKSQIEHLETSVKVAQSRIKALKHAQTSLKYFTLSSLETMNTKKIVSEETGRSISYTLSLETVVDDINLLPNEYKVEKVTVSPDKARIKEDIKNGVVVPGARVIENKNVQFK